MKVKTSELTGAALDWAVAKCWYSDRRVELTEGKTGVRVLRDPTYDGSEYSHWFVFFGSTDWSQGGPVIERTGMDLKNKFETEGRVCMAHMRVKGAKWVHGDTPLIAAMRCYVAYKLGAEVEIPEELK